MNIKNETLNPLPNKIIRSTACNQDTGTEKRVEATLHLSRMGVIVMDRARQEVLDRLAVNMIRRWACACVCV
jgi:hypothetical protein